MNNLKNHIDNEFSHITLNASEEEIISKSTLSPARRPVLPQLIAAVIAVAVIAGICFISILPGDHSEPPTETLPTDKSKPSFVIYAGAQELSTDKYVVISKEDENFIHFDFNKILDEDADPTEITKRYLFHSLEKRFSLRIEGENIDHFLYFVNRGLLTEIEKSLYDENDKDNYFVGWDFSYVQNGKYKNIIMRGYDSQDNTTLALNPVTPVSPSIRLDLEMPVLTPYIALPQTGEILTDNNFKHYLPSELHVDAESLDYDPIAYGFKTEDEPVATEAEIKKLREYAKADDMVGFYNYQNQIFKRLFDSIYVDILIYKIDSTEPYYHYETARLEFCYNPINVTAKDIASKNQSETLSKGTLSAKLTDMPEEQQEELLGLISKP